MHIVPISFFCPNQGDRYPYITPKRSHCPDNTILDGDLLFKYNRHIGRIPLICTMKGASI